MHGPKETQKVMCVPESKTHRQKVIKKVMGIHESKNV
jgi:hypothetical protein